VELTHNARMAVALVPASELVDLPGIEDRTLFSRNVRLYAGGTRINKELRDTVQDLDEHRLFPAYHNGLTLLTNEIESVQDGEIRLHGVGVVNGCQSLITLHSNRSSLTDELYVLVKVVEVVGNDQVADLITYRSNNQNAVTLRDQRSSDNVMRDLKQGIADTFVGQFALVTRLGEAVTAPESIDNALAAQLIMAAYLKEPWSAVRKVRLFDQDFRRIFNRQVSPHRIYLLHLIDQVLQEGRSNLIPELRGSFASIRFTLVHLVCVVLRLSDAGARLLEEPESWLPDAKEAVRDALRPIVREVIDSANYHIKSERKVDELFDPKSAFKSHRGVARLESDVERDASRAADRPGSSYLFTVTPVDR
jgi:hypothetical protein